MTPDAYRLLALLAIVVIATTIVALRKKYWS